MSLDETIVKIYVDFYITLDDETYNTIYNEVLPEYNKIIEKYNIPEDNNYLMALLIVKRFIGLLQIRNLTYNQQKINRIEQNVDAEIQRILKYYTTPMMYHIPE